MKKIAIALIALMSTGSISFAQITSIDVSIPSGSCPVIINLLQSNIANSDCGEKDWISLLNLTSSTTQINAISGYEIYGIEVFRAQPRSPQTLEFGFYGFCSLSSMAQPAGFATDCSPTVNRDCLVSCPSDTYFLEIE